MLQRDSFLKYTKDMLTICILKVVHRGHPPTEIWGWGTKRKILRTQEKQNYH